MFEFTLKEIKYFCERITRIYYNLKPSSDKVLYAT